jgi:hypothetical protein
MITYRGNFTIARGIAEWTRVLQILCEKTSRGTPGIVVGHFGSPIDGGSEQVSQPVVA